MMQEGKTTTIILDGVSGFYGKMFSLTTAMRRGAKISSEGMTIRVEISIQELQERGK